jgi:hypothetical protein
MARRAKDSGTTGYYPNKKNEFELNLDYTMCVWMFSRVLTS